MTEYLRARRHSPTWFLKETAASRRRAIAWSCSCVDRGKTEGSSSSCAGSSSCCMACSSLAASLLVDLMTTSSVGVGVAIAESVGGASTRDVEERPFATGFDRSGSLRGGLKGLRSPKSWVLGSERSGERRGIEAKGRIECLD